VQDTKGTIEASLREPAGGTEGERWPVFDDQADRWAGSGMPWRHGRFAFIVGKGDVHLPAYFTLLLLQRRIAPPAPNESAKRHFSVYLRGFTGVPPIGSVLTTLSSFSRRRSVKYAD